MSGVFEALVATAVGLCVAIPAVVAFNLLQRPRPHDQCSGRFAGPPGPVQPPCRSQQPAGGKPNQGEPDGRKNRRRATTMTKRASMSDINVTPLVDVTLVLFIVFMITVPAIVGSAQLKVDLPESIAADPTVAELPLRLAVRREASGEVGLYLNDQRTDETVAQTAGGRYPQAGASRRPCWPRTRL